MHSISFGKKNPVAVCKVKDLATKKFVPVKMYEYDCKDIEDIQEVENLPNSFGFKQAIANEMRTKKAAWEKYSLNTGVSYYVMQEGNNNVLGIASVNISENTNGVKFIQTSQNSTHKYIGQTMLAALSKLTMNDGKEKFEISFPTDDAMGFYIYKCGFKHGDNFYSLEMSPKEMKKFVFKTQMKTRSSIVDIRG